MSLRFSFYWIFGGKAKEYVMALTLGGIQGAGVASKNPNHLPERTWTSVQAYLAYLPSSASAPCGTWLACANIDVALWVRICERVNSVVSFAKSTSRMRLSASCVL